MYNIKPNVFLLLLCMCLGSVHAQKIEGELRKWHKMTLSFEGPQTNETASKNPFSDYRLEVIFRKGNKQYKVPGFFAADGNAANSSASSGNIWQVHFAPDETGVWNYDVSFKTGKDVALSNGGSSAGFMDGEKGTFNIAESNKSGRDHRGKGRLAYVGEHYLQFAETKEWFVKAGADAPENKLSYTDFDATPKAKKNWGPHMQDFTNGDAGAYTWKNGKGKGLLGALAYLSGKGANAFSFLTFSLDGDDDTVYPHLQKKSGATSWNDVHHDRFDISKMAQWEKIFEYADKKGLYLHVKTQETENDQKMDGGNVGRERKLYYRELIARYAHHLALNWNLGEENTQTDGQIKGMAQFFYDHDPYQHNVVIHTYPNQKNKYGSLTGNKSKLTGASLQTSNATYQEVFNDVITWVKNSAASGKKWIVAVDEPGNASKGTDVDPKDRKLVRHKVVWATLMAGGTGVEFYYGYQTGCSDLTCQDHRTRDQKYTDAAYALKFFQQHFQPYLPTVINDNAATSDGADYVIRATSKKAYAVYRPNGGSTRINLPAGDWQVQWYNPRSGQMQAARSFSGDLVAPDGNDWVALLKSDASTPTPNPCVNNQKPTITLSSPVSDAKYPVGSAVVIETIVADSDGKIEGVEFFSNGNSLGTDASAPFQWRMPNIQAGNYEVYAVAIDDCKDTQRSVTVKFEAEENAPDPGPIPPIADTMQRVMLAPIHDAYLDNGKRYNVSELRTELQRRKTYLMFDLSDIQGDIQKAVLQLTVGSDPGNGRIEVALGDHSGWTETNLSMSNRPIPTNVLNSQTHSYASGNTYQWDLGTLTNSDKLSLVLTHSQGNDVAFLSKEHSNVVGRPKLLVVTSQELPDDPNPNPDPTPGPAPVAKVIPGTIQAENFDTQRGIQMENTADNGGGENIGWVQQGDFTEYYVKVEESGKYRVTFRVASNTRGGDIVLKKGNSTLTKATVPNTGGWQKWMSITKEVDLTIGEQTLRMAFEGGSGYLFNVNWLKFEEGIVEQPDPIDPDPPAPPIPPVAACKGFEEKSGILVIEAESLPIQAPWRVVQDNKATGGAYITWTGGNSYGKADKGITAVSITINKTGKYRFLWHMRQPDGVKSDLSNDSWLNFPDAKFMDKDGKEWKSFIKVFGNGKGNFAWKATADVNHQKSPVFVSFPNPGVYTLQIAGRSERHQIDRMVLFHESVSQGKATDLNLSESPCNSQQRLQDPRSGGLEAVAKEPELSIYPNPTRLELFIDGREVEGKYIKVFDLIGREVLQLPFQSPLNLAGLSPGIYHLRVGNSPPKRFIKK
ncbi:MAG: carbohydrate-binding protein [Bacteroidota bacterium]